MFQVNGRVRGEGDISTGLAPFCDTQRGEGTNGKEIQHLQGRFDQVDC